MAYSPDDIFIESIFEVKDIYNVSFKIEPNTHPVLAVECSVKENQNIESIVKDCKLVYNNKISNFMEIAIILEKMEKWLLKVRLYGKENHTM